MLKSTYHLNQKPAEPAPSTSAAPALPPLPPGWTEHKAPAGHTYYYHAETKQSTYKRPIIEPHFLQQEAPIPSYASGAFAGGFNAGQFQGSESSARGGHASFRGGHGYQDRRREPADRPKHKYVIPGFDAWVLVKTKLGRRFVHNTETGESFWKIPEDVLKGVLEFDIAEARKKAGKGPAEPEEKPVATVEGPSKPDEAGGSSDEYEEVEVEVTDSEGEDGPSKRLRTEEPPEDVDVEFDEDDIAYQLQAMGEEYGLESGEYGFGDEEMEEGAEGIPLTEDDSKALFRDLLEDFVTNPYKTWDQIVEEGRIIEDDRYLALPNMRSRREFWDEWSRERIHQLQEQRKKQEKQDPKIPYFAFLQEKATPKLYWPEFKRKYRKEPAMRDAKVTDKDREKWYREHVKRLQMAHSTLKADLTALLKGTPLSALNRSTSIASLPPSILTDLRYISLSPRDRDPLIEAYISTLPPPPEAPLSAEQEAELVAQRRERERREKALAERERRVQEAKRKQQKDLAYGRGRLREEEMELDRAMNVGKSGLRAHLDDADDIPIPEKGDD
ncbi:hypothetical protein EJ06DRAFT_583370 [Trichodelitschia bisporula]|uniref:WW domain-containing protein n=1 Tax=Trichodelitschia bisporula TaxID=703511 RepID=A0A6G1HRS8_9PEZI|nr:hypothetical protein EJ06DRAFT_583370 [Trichodelitschia bisporula]